MYKDNSYYTKERNAQIVLSLLKEKGIRKVIASPGTTNIAIVGSMQHDPFFEMYSAPDERSAGYLACGLSAESGEPVVLTCTGATASRNYLPALTEAYYRKLPIVALTSSLEINRSGHLFPQFIDRTFQPKDTVKCSVQIPPITSSNQEWECVVKTNQALLELERNGGGPVHINLMTAGEFTDFSTKVLPQVRNITRYTYCSDFPLLPFGKIAIFVGAHKQMSEELTKTIDNFCAYHDCIVYCDHTSGYNGNFKVLSALIASQKNMQDMFSPDLLIHIGEVSGDYYTLPQLKLNCKEVWRINPDGEIRDYFRKLTKVFEIEEIDFFKRYVEIRHATTTQNVYYGVCQRKIQEIRKRIPNLPFSNLWMASILSKEIPHNSVLHFGILNSLRAWNFFELDKTITTSCNVGGFGIDGCLSTLIGASIASPNKLCFGILGDLAFFYDMNVLGNRHIKGNLRILLVNNGKGTEFRNYSHPASSLGNEADDYIAAARHYGNQSPNLVRNYANDLGYTYLSASTKEDFLNQIQNFVDKSSQKSIIFEVFTNNENESDALQKLREMSDTTKDKVKSVVKKAIH